MKSIPILLDHDPLRPIGELRAEGDELRVHMAEPIDREELFEALGGVGVLVEEAERGADGVVRIRKARILEFSVCRKPGPQGT